MPGKSKPVDPWADDPSMKSQNAIAPQGNDDDWKVWRVQGSNEQQPSMMQRAIEGGKDLLKGAGEGIVSTMSGPDEWMRTHAPAFMTNSNFGFGPPANLQHVHELATPANSTQAIGKGAEQVGEFFIPGGAEEAAGEKLATMAPKVAKFAKPLARIAGGEAVNEAQGGTPGLGAAGGAAGEAVGAGLRSMAPYAAETAMRIPMAARAFGKTPGKAILEDTAGIRPSTVGRTAKETINRLTPEMEQAAAQSTTPVSMAPARQTVSNAATRAEQENAAGIHGQLQPMTDFLNRRFATGQAIPQDVSASDALNLKRGFSKEFLGRWNPDIHEEVSNTGRRAYHDLDTEFDKAVPMAAGANQRISSLIPVMRAADKAERAPSLFQRTAGRLGAHTGALTLGGLGAAGGYREAGAPGAIAGGLAGLVGPELAFSPESQMMTARLLNSLRGLKPVTGLALQANRKGTGGQAQ